MDLVRATGDGGLPPNISLTNSGAAAVDDPKIDHDWFLMAHMTAMLASFLVLFPLGYLLLRYFDSVKYHWWMQSVAIVVVLMGVGLGVYESRLFNKVRPHIQTMID